MYMNDLVKSKGTILVGRTPALIAAEINDIKQRTKKMILYNSIEIGRRLVEAKSLLNHGEWGEWLENSVDYSQSTAENFMRIFDEYGAEQLTLLEDNAKSQTFGNLSYSQAVALFAVPAEEREQFIEENDLESKSVREIQQAIKERDMAREEKEQAEHDKNTALEESKAAKAAKKAADEKNKTLSDEKDKLKKKLDEADKKAKDDISKKNLEIDKHKKELEGLNKKIKDLESKSLDVHAGATDEDIEKVRAEEAEKHEKDLALLRVEKEQAEKRIKELEVKTMQQNNASTLKYKVYFDLLVDNFNNLIKSLSDIKDADAETHDRLKNATFGLLNKMFERLN